MFFNAFIRWKAASPRPSAQSHKRTPGPPMLNLVPHGRLPQHVARLEHRNFYRPPQDPRLASDRPAACGLRRPEVLGFGASNAALRRFGSPGPSQAEQATSARAVAKVR